jgi:hypothetical protein
MKFIDVQKLECDENSKKKISAFIGAIDLTKRYQRVDAQLLQFVIK